MLGKNSERVRRRTLRLEAAGEVVMCIDPLTT